MSTQLVYGRALYYPYINFRDENWLKVAALFYDGLDRIVPFGYDEFTDIEITKRLNENEDFIRNHSMRGGHQFEMIDLGRDFVHFAKHNLVGQKERKVLGELLNSPVNDSEPYKIYESKVSHLVREALIELGLINEENGYMPILSFDNLTGRVYMSFLANFLAAKHHLPLVTDDPSFNSLIRCAQYDLKASYQSKIDYSEMLGSLIISAAVPQNIESIPISKIVEFRNTYKDERLEFYIQVNQLVKDLENIDNPGALNDCLQFKKKQVERAVKNLDRAFVGMGFATATILLGLSVPHLAAGLGTGYAAAGLIALGTSKLIGQGIDYYKTKASSPYSYVLSLKKLQSQSLAESLLRGTIVT